MKKMLSMMLVVAMMLSSITVALGEETQAETQVETQAVVLPDSWAFEEVVEAEQFGVVSTDIDANFTSDATMLDVATVIFNLSERLDVNIEGINLGEDPYALATRKDAIKALHFVRFAVESKNFPEMTVEEDENIMIEAMRYREILLGRGNGDLALDDICTRQELFLLGKRALEELTYIGNTANKNVYWEVSDNDNTVSLLGSVHAGDAGIFPLNKAAVEAYEAADALAVEANILQQQNLAAYLQSIMFIEEDITIFDLIGKEAYDEYEKVMANILPKQVYDKLKPWYASMLLESLAVANSGYNAGYGVDQHFLIRATVTGKEIIELEGGKYQYDLFNGFTNKTQRLMLENSIAAISKPDASKKAQEQLKAIIQAWKDGDIKELAKLVYSDEELSENEKEVTDKIYTIRNNEMTKKVVSFIKDTEKNYFVIVGAAHMVGDTGIVKQLEDLGYTVKRIVK